MVQHPVAERYDINNRALHLEMLERFIEIRPGDLEKAKNWLTSFGVPQGHHNYSLSELYSNAERLRWLHQLFSSASMRDKNGDLQLEDWLYVDSPGYERAGLLPEESVLLSRLEGAERAEHISMEGLVRLTPETSRHLAALRLKMEQFGKQFTCIGFSGNMKIGAPYRHHIYYRRPFKSSPERLRYAAVQCAVALLGNNMSSGFHSVAPSITWTQEPRSGEWSWQWAMEVKDPWQAMNFALYKIILADRPLQICRYCGAPFQSKRRSKKYCPSPKTCKDDYNNRIKPQRQTKYNLEVRKR
jgi:hypothetical protein